MTEKETADELRQKAQELLAIADKISPPKEALSDSPQPHGNAPSNPGRLQPDWLDIRAQEEEELRKSRQLSD